MKIFESLILSMRLSRPYNLHKTFLNVTRTVLKILMQLDLYSIFFIVYIALVFSRPCVCKRALGMKKKTKPKPNGGTKS